MRPVTLVLTGLPQFVRLVELDYNLNRLLDANDIGTFEILRDVSCYRGRRKIELDFSSTYDAFVAQSLLDRYVYKLKSGEEYTLSAKLSKIKNMANATIENNYWNAIALPTMSGEVVEQAHAKLDVQLDLLKKQEQVLKAQKAVLKAKKKLQKEYSKASNTSSGEKLTSSRLCTTPRNQSRSKSASRERQPSPVKYLETPPPEKPRKKIKRKPQIRKYTKSRCWNRSSSRSLSPLKNGGSSSTKRRSLSKNRIFKSRSPETENRRLSTRNPLSPSKNRRSPTKNRRSRSTLRRSSSIKRQSSSSKQRTPSKDRSTYSTSRSTERFRSKNRRIRSGKRRSNSIKRRSNSRKRRSNSRKRRSNSRKRRSNSRNRCSLSTDRCSRSRNRRWSPRYRRSNSKHRHSSSTKQRCPSRSRIYRSRSKFTRSRSRVVRKRWRSRSRERSPKYSAQSKTTRKLWSPELYRRRSKSRETVYRVQRFLNKVDSPTRLPSRLAIMPAPMETIEDPGSILVKRNYYEAPTVSEYFSDFKVTDYYDVEDHSSKGIRYICEADKDNVPKCTELDTNVPNKLTDTDCHWSVSNEEIKETLDPIGQAIEVVVSNSNPCEDNSVVEKPLVEILLGICKDSSVAAKTGAVGLNDEKVLESRVEIDACYTVSDGCNDLNSKTHFSEAPLEGNTKSKENNFALREIHMRDANNDEDVKHVIDLTKNTEIVKINSSPVYRKFKFSEGPNVDEDIKPVIDLEKIPKVIEVKDESPSILQTTKYGSNFDDDVKPVIDKENIHEMKRNTLPLTKRPRFVIVIRTLMKEMGPSLKKAKHDCMKMSFQCKFIHVLRRTIRDLILGKDIMRSPDILRVFREKYPKGQDDQFVRQLVEDMKAGKYGDLGPSDDEIADGDDVVLVENKYDTINLIDSDDESKPLRARNENVNNIFSRAMNPPIECPPTKPRVLIPYPNSMAARRGTEVKLESNVVVPEFTDMELENILKCMESAPSNNMDGTETPHVTGITIMTSLSELFSLKYGKKETKTEQDIKTEHNALSEEYAKDDAQFYNPYEYP